MTGSRLSAIVLAAGTSSRMPERNKLLLPFGAQTILETVIDNLETAGLTEIIVVTGHEADKVETAIRHLNVMIIHNDNFAAGMTGSIKAGVAAASGDAFMICLGDMPMIGAKDYQVLHSFFLNAREVDEKVICVPSFEDRRGNPVVFAGGYKKEILDHQNPEGCKEILLNNSQHVKFCEMPSANVLKDIDLLSDYCNIHKDT